MGSWRESMPMLWGVWRKLGREVGIWRGSTPAVMGNLCSKFASSNNRQYNQRTLYTDYNNQTANSKQN